MNFTMQVCPLSGNEVHYIDESPTHLPCSYDVCTNCAKLFVKQLGAVSTKAFTCQMMKCRVEHHDINDESVFDFVNCRQYQAAVKSFLQDSVGEVRSARLRGCLEGRSYLDSWFEKSESDIEIHVESLKMQLDEVNESLRRRVDRLEERLKASGEKGVRRFEKFSRFFTDLFLFSYELVESLEGLKARQLGFFYTYKPVCENIQEAIQRGHLDDFEYYLNLAKRDVNEPIDSSGWTCIHYASSHSQLRIIKLLYYRYDANVHVMTLFKDNSVILASTSRSCTVNVVEFLLNKGVDVNLKNSFERSALSNAISCDNFPLVRLLLARKAETKKHKDSDHILHSVLRRDLRIIEALIRAGVDVNERNRNDATVLIEAADNGKPDVVKILLANKADLNAQDSKGKTALIRVCLPNNFREAHRGDECAELLLRHNAEVNTRDERGNTALICACENGFEKIVEMILEKNVDVNAKNDKGVTPLISATFAMNSNIVKLLLDRTAINVNEKDNIGRSALLWASINGLWDICDALLLHNADMNAKDHYGDSALMHAIMNKKTNITEKLLEKGAYVNLSNNMNQTALCLASSSDDFQTVKLLIEAGAVLMKDHTSVE